MQQVKVSRQDGSEVWVVLAQCKQKHVDGQMFFQAPDGWWFYRIREGTEVTQKLVDYGTSMVRSEPILSYHEADLVVGPPRTRTKGKEPRAG